MTRTPSAVSVASLPAGRIIQRTRCNDGAKLSKDNGAFDNIDSDAGTGAGTAHCRFWTLSSDKRPLLSALSTQSHVHHTSTVLSHQLSSEISNLCPALCLSECDKMSATLSKRHAPRCLPPHDPAPGYIAALSLNLEVRRILKLANELAGLVHTIDI